MAEVTIYDVYNALGLTAENGTQTLINSIRNSTELSGMTEVFDGSVQGLQNFGVAVNRNSNTQNMFVNELYDRIGLVIVERTQIKNPLKRFKKGRMDNGKSVQEIFTDLIKAESFNPEDAVDTLLKRNPPNVRVLYHNNWRKELYTNTIERTTLREAFTSIENFNDFVATTFDAVYNSNEVDEYLWTKSLIESYVANGFATYVETTNVTDQTSAIEFVKKTRSNATKMTLPQGSRLFNATGVHTRTPKERLWIMIDADLDATLDVDVLSRAFNISQAQIEKQKIVVENFAVNGLQAVMFDERILQIRDKEFEMTNVQNAKGLYWNTFLHVHQLFSMGKFQNFVAFMSEGIPPITKLVVTPIANYVTLNKTKVLDGFIEFRRGLKMSDVTLAATVTTEDGAAVTGATATIESDIGNGFKVNVIVTNAALKDQNLSVNVTATEVVPEGEEESAFVRSASAIVVPLPPTEER